MLNNGKVLVEVSKVVVAVVVGHVVLAVTWGAHCHMVVVVVVVT